MSSVPCTSSSKPLPADDLRRVVEQVGEANWELLRDKYVVVTGSRGFVGQWMALSLYEAQQSIARWIMREERYRDVENWWPSHKPDYIIHATTDGVGWQHVAAIARAAGARMLLLSSGAVYGQGPAGEPHAPVREESYLIPQTAYAVDKQQQERGCADIAVIARLFSFIGPGLRRHTGREFLEADPITVNDDGAVRSYLYASDMAAWLWTILLRGQVGRAYNVGSDEPTKVKDLAHRCGSIRSVNVSVAQPSIGGTYYVPDVWRAERELGLRQTVGMDEAIRRTLAWQSK